MTVCLLWLSSAFSYDGAIYPPGNLSTKKRKKKIVSTQILNSLHYNPQFVQANKLFSCLCLTFNQQKVMMVQAGLIKVRIQLNGRYICLHFRHASLVLWPTICYASWRCQSTNMLAPQDTATYSQLQRGYHLHCEKSTTKRQSADTFLEAVDFSLWKFIVVEAALFSNDIRPPLKATTLSA